MRIPIVRQMQASDQGAAVLGMMLAFHGRKVPLSELRKVCVSSRNGSSIEQIREAGHHYNLNIEVRKIKAENLSKIACPFAAIINRRNYVIVEKITSKKVTYVDSRYGRNTLPLERFDIIFGEQVMEFSPGEGFKRGGHVASAYEILMKRVAPYKKGILVLSILSSIAVLMSMLYISLQKSMIDKVMSQENFSLFIKLAAFLCAVWICQFIAESLQTLLSYSLSRKMAANSEAKVLNKILHLPMSYFEKINSGELINRLRRNNSVDNSLITVLVPQMFKCFVLVFYLILIYSYNPLIATILLLVQIASSIVIILVRKELVLASKGAISIEEAMQNRVISGFDSIESIKASGSESKFFSMWYSTNDYYRENARKSARLNAVVQNLKSVQTLTTDGIMLFLGAYLMTQGEFTMGALSCMQSMWNQVGTSMMSLFNTTNQIETLMADVERIDDINKRESRADIPLPEEDMEKLSGNLKIEGLNYRYNPGDPLALEDINIDIHPGEMVALVGSSGSGKSTLMKLMAGIYKPQKGEILYDKMTREEIPDVVFHSSVATVDQEICLFGDTVRANLKMWDETIEDFEMILAARDAQIHQRIMNNQNGYDEWIDEKGSCYSGGEKQRIELARALSLDTTILILDEFTSALDAMTEERIFDSLREKGTTCIIAAHRLSTVKGCDKIVVLEHGRIVETGSHQELYDKKGKYYELINMA